MKALLLKDLYNIGHNAKQMIIVMIFVAVCIIPSSGVYSYIPVCSVLFCMMTTTTFSMDERSGWTKYALIMPVSPKTYVLEKYVLHLIFSLTGTLLGTLSAFVFSFFTHTFDANTFLGCSLAGLLIALYFGSLHIPFLFRFGAEQARLMMIVMALIPASVGFAAYKLMEFKQIPLTNNLITGLLIGFPIFLVFLIIGTYIYSLRCLQKKEF